jgi:hypothetical protein
MGWIVYIRSMNVDAFDLNLLRTLDALLAERAVGRAAVRLGLSQPAMSHALRASDRNSMILSSYGSDPKCS